MRSKELRRREFCALLISSMMIVGLFTLPAAFSSFMSTLVISNTGKILLSEVTAKSGSSQDIQAAVDVVASLGGGTVNIPAGSFAFDFSQNRTWSINGGIAGVIIPGGVSVIGAGPSSTILIETTNPPGCPMFLLDGYNGKPIRISGIYFKGFCNNETGGNGIFIFSSIFRIDHCSFTDFSGTAIFTSTNYRQQYVLRGLIDHCNIDNPYKDNLTMGDYTHRLWGYGVGCQRDDYAWNNDTGSILGHYDDNPSVVYIEDCNFRRCRHAIAANGGAHYVARHNNFAEMIISWYGSYCDAHGATGPPPAVGTRLVEIYDNTFTDSPTDSRSTDQQAYWGQYMGMGVGIRGGAAVIFNNIFTNMSKGVQLYSDASNENCRPKEIYIWNNTYVNVNTPLRAMQKADGYSYDIVNGTDYFQYARAGYVPYPYPHPLTLLG